LGAVTSKAQLPRLPESDSRLRPEVFSSPTSRPSLRPTKSPFLVGTGVILLRVNGRKAHPACLGVSCLSNILLLANCQECLYTTNFTLDFFPSSSQCLLCCFILVMHVQCWVFKFQLACQEKLIYFGLHIFHG